MVDWLFSNSRRLIYSNGDVVLKASVELAGETPGREFAGSILASQPGSALRSNERVEFAQLPKTISGGDDHSLDVFVGDRARRAGARLVVQAVEASGNETGTLLARKDMHSAIAT